jgi:hypothetical protein
MKRNRLWYYSVSYFPGPDENDELVFDQRVTPLSGLRGEVANEILT